jgi:hypothetical protein
MTSRRLLLLVSLALLLPAAVSAQDPYKEALEAFGKLKKQSQERLAQVKPDRIAPGDLNPPSTVRPKGIAQVLPDHEVRKAMEEVKPVTVRAKSGNTDARIMVKVWAELKAGGEKVQLSQYAWKPGEEFYLYLEAAVPVKLAIYQDYPDGKSVARLPVPEVLESLDVLKPGEPYRVPAEFSMDADVNEELMRLVMVRAGSGNDPTIKKENDKYTFKGLKDYVTDMGKVQKETKDSKYTFKSASGPKPRSTNADDVAEVLFGADNQGAVVLKLKKAK